MCSPISPAQPTSVAKACYSLHVPPFPRCVRAEVPSAGFPPEPLERATKASNYPWPSGSPSLCLPLRAPAACSSLLSPSMLPSLALFAPSHVQNNPSAQLQPLIAAISDKGDVWGKVIPKVSQGDGLQHLRVCHRCLESHCFDSTNSLFQDVPFAGEAILENRSLTAGKTERRQGRWWLRFRCWKRIICKLNPVRVDFISYAHRIYF